MLIDNAFNVSVPIERAWEVLTDLEGIAPCMPGAQLTGSQGGTFSGRVRVKVGPVTTEYAGTARFVERDGAAFRAVIDAKGRDSRGSGTASAVITTQLRPDGARTSVRIDTDLKISGKIAQFGSAMIAEVSEKLLGQFVDCLEARLATATGATSPPSPPGAPDSSPDAADGAPSRSPTFVVVADAPPEPEALDLLELAGHSLAKRAVPLAIGVAVVVGVVIYLIVR